MPTWPAHTPEAPAVTLFERDAVLRATAVGIPVCS
jgi:hypothetical protein